MDKLLKLHNDLSDVPLKKEKYIYHYTSQMGLDGILMHQNIWANDIYRQNDKSEGIYILELLKNNIDRVCTDECSKKLVLKQVQELSPKLVEGFYNSDKYRTFIISFSTKEDELPLWNYYTKDVNSVGYNIQFNVDRLVSNLETIKIKIECNHSSYYLDSINCVHGKVIYDETEQLNILKRIVTEFSEATDVRNEEWAFLLVDKLLWVGNFIKNPSFRHEYEYRLSFFTYTNKSELNLDKVPVEYECNEKSHIEIYFDGLALGNIVCSPTNSKAKIEYPQKYMTRQYPNFREVTKSKIPFRIM